MERAVIDMGTNTFNLLIAGVSSRELNVVFKKKFPVLLGMGGINEGVLCSEAIQRAKDTLIDFKEECSNRGVTNILAIGTSAMRSVCNANEIVDFAHEIDINVKIVSGDIEAKLIYQGVSWLTSPQDDGLIMDIGGGSTEFIVFEKEKVVDSESLDIGVSRIFQTLGKPKEFTKENYKWIIDFFNESKPKFSQSSVRNLYGASGSFETLYEMIEERKFDSENELIQLELSAVENAIDWILNSTYEERQKNKWIADYRKEMIPIAALKIKWVLDNLKIDSIYICPYSLKEGAMKMND